ncbi:hydroxymethylglutaryl-CoA lyase [Auritidibacter ignavus]|uniref:hydroxymethylglutaryl-CoA lyase n=1 Tax=Auritidibacter ignavus TaxID=678932 RepID=UPI002FE650B7
MTVRVHEVGPRDGLQAESVPLSVETKLQFCEDLVNAGVDSIEVGSFVHPDWVPQMAQTEELFVNLQGVDPGVRLTGLVLNRHGLDRASSVEIKSIAVFASCTESFAIRNMNSSREESLNTACLLASEAVGRGVEVRGYLSMCFGDPWEGRVDPQVVVSSAERLLNAGCNTIAISDTIGVAGAGQVRSLLERFHSKNFPIDSLAAHFHDTYGQAIGNVAACLEAGVAEFDSSASGLGRCPFAPGATGNVATEDLLWFLHTQGFATTIDIAAVATASDAVDQVLERSTTSAVKRALIASHLDEL